MYAYLYGAMAAKKGVAKHLKGSYTLMSQNAK